MKRIHWCGVIAMGCLLSQATLAQCVIAGETRQLDPVEVGFCESDAVFVGKVESRVETIRAYREEGSDRTKHYRIEVSTIKVGKEYKESLPGKVTMNADLYDKKAGAFSFGLEKEYLVFAKKLPTGEYAGASAACSVQPTLPVADAQKAIEQLEQHRKGTKKIDCSNIRPKS